MKENFGNEALGRSKHLGNMEIDEEAKFRLAAQKIQKGDLSSFAEFRGFFKSEIAAETKKFAENLDPIAQEELEAQIDTELMLFVKNLGTMREPYMYSVTKEALPGIIDNAVLALGNQGQREETSQERKYDWKEAELIAEADLLTRKFEQSINAEGLVENIGNNLGRKPNGKYISSSKAFDILPYLFGEENMQSISKTTELSIARLHNIFAVFRDRIREALSKTTMARHDLDTDVALEHFKKKLRQELSDFPTSFEEDEDGSSMSEMDSDEHISSEGKASSKQPIEKKVRRELTFSETKERIRLLGIGNEVKYKYSYKQYDLPKESTLASFAGTPKYPDGSIDWKTFFTETPWTYEDLRKDILSKNIVSVAGYRTNAPSHNWPEWKFVTAMPEFPKTEDSKPNTNAFLEVKPKETVTWPTWTAETLIADIKAKGVTSESEFKKARSNEGYFWPNAITSKKFPGLPFYPNNSVDWKKVFTGESWTYEDLHKDILTKLKNPSKDKYESAREKYNWPTLPTLIAMEGFPKIEEKNDWDTFYERKNFTIDELKSEVAEKGVTNQKGYLDNMEKYGWPLFYKVEGFPRYKEGPGNWYAFFNNNENVTLDKMKSEMLTYNIKSHLDYDRLSEEHNWPPLAVLRNMPDFPKTQQGKNDWDAFYGIAKKVAPETLFVTKEGISYEKLKSEVQHLGIKTISSYIKAAANRGWPSLDELGELEEVKKMKSWNEFFGR